MSEYPRILGIDIGSVAMGVVEIDGERKIIFSAYDFHHGDIVGTLRKLMQQFPFSGAVHIAVTSSSPLTIAASKRFDNQIALIAAARHYHPEMRGMLVVGGEKFSLSTFDEDGHYQGSTFNTSCAAGTGSFLDQQAVRLNMKDIKSLNDIACANRGSCPRIASRCAVFAKTDLIHAQQEGYQLSEISDGLCYGLAKNIVDTLFCSTKIQGEIVFCGGVSKNTAVVSHIENLIGTKLVTTGTGHFYGAIGAALEMLHEIEADKTTGCQPWELNSADDLLVEQGKRKKFYYDPLVLRISDYPDFRSYEKYESAKATGNPVEVDIYREINSGEKLDLYLGVDIGSTSTKAILMEENQEVLAGFYTRTAGRPLGAVQQIFRTIHEIESGKQADFRIARCGTTGSGRKFIGRIIGADGVIDEITAHARAACRLNPQVDTIIEIGGQDAKFTTLKNGRVTSSTMNNVCAAGTGSFIEEQAAKFGCPVKEYSSRTENVRAPMASDRCTVFMERDMNHHLSEGYDIDEVLASALHAVRENYLSKVATEKNIGKVILFQGATAKNKALVAAFEQRLQRPLQVSKFCHLTGALGTALILHDEKSSAKTSFRGLRIYENEIPASTEVCEICSNHCKISVAEIQGEKVAYGFLCGRDYETKSYVKRGSLAFNLLGERKKIGLPDRAEKHPEEITIGIPYAVHLVEDFDFWKKFFGLLGINTVTSEGYKDALKIGKNLSRAEFCAPVQAMHGHVHWLMERADYVFMPFYLENRGKEVRRQYCYYTQFLPSLVSTIHEGQPDRFLRPIIKYLYTSFHTRIELFRMLKGKTRRAINFFEISSAFDLATEFDMVRRKRLKELYTERSRRSTDVHVVFLGRPYTVLSPAMNGGIPSIFASLGIDAYYQDMLTCESYRSDKIGPLLRELHWEHASRIIEVTEVIAREKGVYPVYLTSFKCSPDAFALEYFKSIMEVHGKPYLILELDGHDSSVGYETRIEAAIRSFRNHRENREGRKIFSYGTINPQIERKLEGKNIVFPNWDRITCNLLVATLKREGYNVHLIEESEKSIRESLKTNTGQCIPLNAIAEGYISCIEEKGLDPASTVLWLNKSTIACNIKLYPHHIKTLLNARGGGMEKAGVYCGELSFIDISVRAAMNAYFAYMFGGMLRKVACRIRPYEREKGQTDKVLNQGIKILSEAFQGRGTKENALSEIISHFSWIETDKAERPKIAVFGDLYVRDNRVMSQDIIRFIEENGGEVVTTPYTEYAKMIAGSYFRKWFNERKFIDMLSHRAILATMTQLEKGYARFFNRILNEQEFVYDELPEKILSEYNISIENTGESMDNILKIHYIKKHYPDISLFVQTSPALCCASLITEAMREAIEQKTGIPVVSIRYDGTGGNKNNVIIPYLKYPPVLQKAKTSRRDLQTESITMSWQ
jgi:predicted CoA-substrate-specific enzyme activase